MDTGERYIQQVVPTCTLQIGDCMKDRVEQWIQDHDGDDYCKYCIYHDDCPGGVIGGPNGPIYPPCADISVSELLDTDAILMDLENNG